MRLEEPDQWEVLVRVVREVVDDGVMLEQEGVGWQSASKVVEEKVVRGLQMVSTEAEGRCAPAGCRAQQSVEIVVIIDSPAVASAQCHAQLPSLES